MSLEIRVLQTGDEDLLLAYERERLAQSQPDPDERELSSWSARWRPESMRHYLPQGWSFGAFNGGRLRGYLLAQPFLFFRGITQTLWVEILSAEDQEVGEALMEVIWKWARDKHIQKLIVGDMSAPDWLVHRGGRQNHEPWFEIATTRSLP